MSEYQILKSLQGIFSVIVGVLATFFGDFDGALKVMLSFVIIDYVTGISAAIIEKRLSSTIGARGIVKKVSIFLIIGMSHMLDMYVMGNTGALRMMVIIFYIANEGVSIIENCTRIGLPVPEKLKDILEQLNNKVVENEEV